MTRKLIPVDIVKAIEPMCEYHLADGTIIRGRIILMVAFRVEGEEAENDGTPKYEFKANTNFASFTPLKGTTQ